MIESLLKLYHESNMLATEKATCKYSLQVALIRSTILTHPVMPKNDIQIWIHHI